MLEDKSLAWVLKAVSTQPVFHHDKTVSEIKARLLLPITCF